ncbi:MAG: hypothetical protein K2G93_02980 [Rikenella sp.]|nr:hypothetical protein [Rikenella sp.]
MAIHLLGIRHHGPGSCRSVERYLRELEPDLILLEGPVEAEALIPHVAEPGMEPPAALLAYRPDEPRQAVFYPFAEFSPEWQTLRYGIDQGVPVRFFDLPLTHSMALDRDEDEKEAATAAEETTEAEEIIERGGDPFDALAEIAGYPDGESWWDATVERRQDNAGIFEAVQEAVTALRAERPRPESLRTRLREAWMRRTVRAAQKEGFERIAVVCGAWHVPALAEMPTAKEDNELLKGLPKVKVECTWIPWTYDRLTLRSGYGAGIASPGWYDHLWRRSEDDGTLWVSRIAALFRAKGMDISVAHVIETVRLAQTAAALRNRPAPSLAEFNEAITAVMGFGDEILLQIIKEELLISDRLGRVPDTVPKVPLLIDVEKTQKRLRIPFTAEIKELALDLRNPNDLERSVFFHRLHLLGIDWARPAGEGDGRGTFRERWSLYHKPEQILQIIETAIWGNTVKEAAKNYLLRETSRIDRVPELTGLLTRAIPADLPELVEAMTAQLDRLSATSTDLSELMEAVPDLAEIVRYGSVRKLDFSRMGDMLRAMVARIWAGGTLVCINIDEEAAAHMLDRILATDYALSTLNDPELNRMWIEFLGRVRTAANVHPLLTGYATRQLNDQGEIPPEEMHGTLRYYTSAGNAPADIAYWFEGFLHASGSILLLDDDLWNLVNDWICTQDREVFLELLPILKRTFSEFSPVERRKLGEKAKAYDPAGGGFRRSGPTAVESLDESEAAKAIPVVFGLLGIETNES